MSVYPNLLELLRDGVAPVVGMTVYDADLDALTVTHFDPRIGYLHTKSAIVGKRRQNPRVWECFSTREAAIAHGLVVTPKKIKSLRRELAALQRRLERLRLAGPLAAKASPASPARAAGRGG